jgi:hypothetical protein
LAQVIPTYEAAREENPKDFKKLDLIA